jgi:hypothetical protein
MDDGVPRPVLPENARPSTVKFDDREPDEEYAGYVHHQGLYVAPAWEDEEPQEFELVVRTRGFENHEPDLHALLDEMKFQLVATVPGEAAEPVAEQADQVDPGLGAEGAEDDEIVEREIIVDVRCTDAGSLKGYDDNALVTGFFVDPWGRANDLFRFRATTGSVTRVRAEVRNGGARVRCGNRPAVTISPGLLMSAVPCGAGSTVGVRCLVTRTYFVVYGGWRG